VPQDDDNEDTLVTHEQVVEQAQDVDAPQDPKQPLKWRHEEHHISSKITLKISSSGVHHMVLLHALDMLYLLNITLCVS